MLRHLVTILFAALLTVSLTVLLFASLAPTSIVLPTSLENGSAQEVAEYVQAQVTQQHWRWFLLSAMVAMALGWLLSVFLSRSVLGPIKRLTKAGRAMAEGNLGVRTSVEGDAELAALAESLNTMAEKMQISLRESRRESIRLRALINGMRDGVCLLDGGGQIVLCNRAFDQLVGREATGKALIDVIESEPIRACLWSALSGTDGLQTTEVEVDGKVQSLLIQASPLEEEGGAVAMIHDVTPLKRADRIRRDFVANASHELRTPLTAIRGFAETLRDGALDDPERARRFVDVILRNAMRLQHVADDLVRLSKAEAGSKDFGLDPVRLEPLISDLASMFEEQAKEKKLRFSAKVDADPIAVSNAVALDHILMNLVQNAFNVSSPGGLVEVLCKGDGDGELVQITVRDEGPGIEEKHVNRIFERFYRVDRGRASDEGGTGLGLAIVKHLAERIDATLSVESQPNHGTTFTISLPPAAEDTAVAPDA